MTKSRNLTTAIHILTVLGFADKNQFDTKITSDYLATSIRTNAGLVRRVMSKLSKAGLIVSQKGKNGGTELAKEMSKINLKEIYEAVEDGEIFKTSNKDPMKDCPISCQLSNILEGVYDDVEDSVKKHLESISLCDVVNRVET